MIKINLIDVLRMIKRDKKMMTIWLIVGAVLGVVIAFGTPKTYKTTVMLAPEESGNGFSGSISSLASMVGMNMKMGQSGDAIYPEIYPDLMASNDFIVGLFNVKVTAKDSSYTCSYYDRLKLHQIEAIGDWPKNRIIELIKKFSSSDGGGGKDHVVNPRQLTKEENTIAEGISKLVTCEVDKKTSVITINVTDQDAVIAAQVADSVQAHLQQCITEYRTKKARNDLKYMEQLYTEAHDQYVKARQEYARFSDANQDVTLQSLQSKIDDLENEMQLKYNIYTQVVEQLQLAKAKVQERTPAFTVVQAASVAVIHSSRSKLMTLLMWLFTAFMLRLCVILWKNKRVILGLEASPTPSEGGVKPEGSENA